MPSEAQADDWRPPETLADKVNHLIEMATAADSGSLSHQDVCFLIQKATGEEFSSTTIWRLRNGTQTNPSMRLVQALATTFGVEPAYFFEDYDAEKLGLLRDQVQLLALVRSAGITSAEFRAILGLDAAGRGALAGLIGRAARAEAAPDAAGEGDVPGSA